MHVFNKQALTDIYVFPGAKLIYSLKYNEFPADYIQEYQSMQT